MWLVQPGRKLVAEIGAEQLSCSFCKSQAEPDLFFGEPRYDPDAIVKPVRAAPSSDCPDGEEQASKVPLSKRSIEKCPATEQALNNLNPEAVMSPASYPDDGDMEDGDALARLDSRRSVSEAQQHHLTHHHHSHHKAHHKDAQEPHHKDTREPTTGDKSHWSLPLLHHKKAVHEDAEDASATASASAEGDSHQAASLPGTPPQAASPKESPQASPKGTPAASPKESPEASPTASPKGSSPTGEKKGLLQRCQGLWYSEDGQKIGSVEDSHIVWCDQTFDGEPSKLTATSDASLTMDLDGEAHRADFHEGAPEKLVWSDGEVWLRK